MLNFASYNGNGAGKRTAERNILLMATFTNQAVLTYGGTQVLSNTTTGQIVESLSAAKTSLQQSYASGDRITYIVTLQNTCSVPLADLTLEDDLGAYKCPGGLLYPLGYEEGSLLVLENGVRQTDVTVTETSPLTVTGIDVPGNGGATVIYTALVNGFAPLQASGAIVNTVSLTGAQLTQPVTAEHTLPVTEGPVLTVSKTLDPLTVSPGESITYTLTIENYGNAEAGAGENAVITDTVQPVLTDLSVTYNGAPWTEGGQYTYSAQTGVFETGDGVITVPAAQFTKNPDGSASVVPGTAVITLQGTVG